MPLSFFSPRLAANLREGRTFDDDASVLRSNCSRGPRSRSPRGTRAFSSFFFTLPKLGSGLGSKVVTLCYRKDFEGRGSEANELRLAG